MPRYRVDFEVKSDLVLPRDAPPLALEAPDCALSIRNGDSRDADGNALSLIATMIGASETMQTAIDDFRNVLGERLDWLTFLTQRRYEIVAPLAAMDWEPGPGRRQFCLMQTNDSRWPPDPELTPAVIESVSQIIGMQLPDFLEVAVRSLRVGARAKAPEEQFPFFWAALETVIEATKEKAKQPIRCQKCRAELTCCACGSTQLRTPMATAAIRDRVIAHRGEEDGRHAFGALLYVRNRLLHGGSLVVTKHGLEKKFGMGLADCTRMVAGLAHSAIAGALLPLLEEHDRSIHIWQADFVVGLQRLGVQGETIHEGPGEHPERMPNIGVEIRTTWPRQ